MAILVVVLLFMCFVGFVAVVVMRSHSSAKKEAYKLLKQDKPDTKVIKQVISKLNKSNNVMKDEDGRVLVQKLMAKIE